MADRYTTDPTQLKYESVLLCTGCYLLPENMTAGQANSPEYRQKIGQEVNIQHAPSVLLEAWKNLSDNQISEKYIPHHVSADLFSFITSSL